MKKKILSGVNFTSYTTLESLTGYDTTIPRGKVMGYSIKEVSERFNISSHTLRYYEKEGLLPPIRRADNGIRQYNDVDLEWIQLICCMRSTGMSIAHIKEYVDLCRLGDDTVAERREILLNQKRIIENEIEKYRGLLKIVNKKLSHYDDIAHDKHKIIDSGKNAASP